MRLTKYENGFIVNHYLIYCETFVGKQIFSFFLLASFAAGSASAKTYKVLIHEMDYEPAKLTIKVGDKVTWVNVDTHVHTATARDASFNSGSIRKKKQWTYKAEKEGEHPYLCLFHPGMVGILTIEKK